MRRVLIVDDDVFYGGLVAKAFGYRKWLPVVCHNMEDALKEIEALRVDLIVTDIFMPGIGGIDGIQFLRTKAPDVPVIAMSGGWDSLGPQEAIKAAVKVGARAGLAKPIQGDQLDAILKDLGLSSIEMGEPDWPKTANKTTDWDEVFDAPVNGLIAWISSADSFDILKISAFNMLDHLLKNTHTQIDTDKYRERLKDIIGRGTSTNAKETLAAIVSLLNEIKIQFKADDARFNAAQKLERFEQRKAMRLAVPDVKPRTSILPYAVAGGGIVVTLLVGLFFAFAGEDKITTAELKADKAKVTKQQVTRSEAARMSPVDLNKPRPDAKTPSAAPASKADEWKPPEQKFTPPADAGPDTRPTLALAALQWLPTPYTPGRQSVRLVPLLSVTSYDDMAPLCDRAPTLMDMVNTALSRVPDTDDASVPTELKALEAPLAQHINAVLQGNIVTAVTLAHGPDLLKIHFINDPCRPLTPAEYQTLNMNAKK